MQLAEEGNYSGTVLKHRIEVSSKGTPSIAMICRIYRKESDILEFEECEPMTRIIQLWLTEGGMDNTRRCLEWFGFNEKTLDRLNPKHPEAFSFEGKTIYLSCRHEEYKERQQERWNMQRRNKETEEGLALSALQAASEIFAEMAQGEEAATKYADAF